MSVVEESAVYRYVEGIYLSNMFDEAALKSMFHRKIKPGDILVAGYPKSGTKWLQYIIYTILNDGLRPKKISDFIQGSTFLKDTDTESGPMDSRPGAMKTHLPFNKAPFSTEAKYVYICRNPYDCCVSYFHHTTYRPAYRFENGTFDEFLDMFLGGKVDFGDYFDNLLSWYEQRDRPNILFLTYEDLKKDTRGWVLKIADFLCEEQQAAKLRDDPNLLDNIIKISGTQSVEYLNGLFSETCQQGRYGQATRGFDRPLSDETPEVQAKPLEIPFIRKGVVGDWKEYFTPDHVRKMKERIALKTASSDVMSLWNDADLP